MDSDPYTPVKHAVALAERLRTEAAASAYRMRAAFAAFDGARRAVYAGHYTRARWRLARYRRRVRFDAFPRQDGRAAGTPRLSIVIVAHRTGEDLLACVRSVLPADARQYEIILVDNGGNDAVLHSLLALPLLYVRCPVNVGASEGRNVGAHFARAPITAFLDDDALAAPGYGQALLNAFENDSVRAVRGRVLPKDDAAHTQAAPHYDLGDDPIPALVETEGNSAFRTETYRALGGMDPLLFGHEGNELSCRILLRHGPGCVLYWPAAVILHDFAVTEEKLAAKNERHRAMMRYLRWRAPRAVGVMREYRELRGGGGGGGGGDGGDGGDGGRGAADEMRRKR